MNEETHVSRAPLTGRAGELAILSSALEGMKAGQGQSILVLGEPGIGKSRLVDEFTRIAREGGLRIMPGCCEESDVRPFGPFFDALGDLMDRSLLDDEASTGFIGAFLVADSGELLAKATGDGGSMDAAAYADMLSAVQAFVRDSFGQAEAGATGLGKLVYGDMTILVEHGPAMLLACVFQGREHPGMRPAMAASLASPDPCGELCGLVKIRFPVRRDTHGVDFENERLRLADHVAKALSCASEESPVLILMEDLHWADSSSLFMFSYLARNVGQDRLLLIGTARPDGGADFARLRHSLLDEGTGVELALEGLDMAGVRNLLDSTLGPNEIPDSFCGRLAAESRGNPLFITEVLRQMADDGGLVLERGTYQLAKEEWELPRSAEELLGRRLASLDPGTMAVAECASCIGQDFAVKELMWLQNTGDIGRAIDGLCLNGIIARRGGLFGFTHAMFRQVIYASISERWRRAYHRSLGEGLESACGEDAGDRIYDLARHFSVCRDGARALRYCALAGDRAMGAYAIDLARDFLASALEFYPGTCAGPGPDEAELLEKLGDAETSLALFGDATRRYEGALGLLKDDESRLRVTLKLGRVLHVQHENEKALAVLRAAATAEAGPEMRGQLWARLALLEAEARNGGEARALAERAQARIMEMNDAGVKAQAFTMLGSVFSIIGPDEDALRMFQAATEEAEASGDMRSLAMAYTELGQYMHYHGEALAASKRLERSAQYYEHMGDIVGQVFTQTLLGMAYSDCGELDRSLAALKRALALSRRTGSLRNTASLLGNIGYTLAMMGRHGESLTYQNESLDIRRKMGSGHGMAWSFYDMSLVHVQLGELDKVESCLSESIALFAGAGDNIGLAYARAAMARCLAEMGDADGAVRMYKETLSIAEQWNLPIEIFSATVGLVGLGALDPDKALPTLEKLARETDNLSMKVGLREFRGALAADRGDADASELQFGEGLGLTSGKSGIDAEIASADLLMARARARGARGDVEGARADAVGAAALYRKWGRIREASKAEAALTGPTKL